MIPMRHRPDCLTTLRCLNTAVLEQDVHYKWGCVNLDQLLRVLLRLSLLVLR